MTPPVSRDSAIQGRPAGHGARPEFALFDRELPVKDRVVVGVDGVAVEAAAAGVLNRERAEFAQHGSPIAAAAGKHAAGRGKQPGWREHLGGP